MDAFVGTNKFSYFGIRYTVRKKSRRTAIKLITTVNSSMLRFSEPTFVPTTSPTATLTTETTSAKTALTGSVDII